MTSLFYKLSSDRIFISIVVLLFISCEFNSGKQSERIADELQQEAPISQLNLTSPKDTIFSVITSDLTHIEGYKLIESLAINRKINFSRELREFGGAEMIRLRDPNAKTTYYQIVYELVLNNMIYNFDIEFDTYGVYEPLYISEVEKLYQEDERDLIDIVALYHRSEDQNLIYHVLELYKSVYGNYSTSKDPASIAPDRILNETTYNFPSRPGLKIIYQNILAKEWRTNFFPGEKPRDPYYVYRIAIVYSSQRFLKYKKQLEELERKKILEEEINKKRKETQQSKDI